MWVALIQLANIEQNLCDLHRAKRGAGKLHSLCCSDKGLGLCLLVNSDVDLNLHHQFPKFPGIQTLDRKSVLAS